ncbi:MAG: tubulin-like doman-containing protein [Xenococcaceae cyanobacterium MO_167.B27]|nr:tubulin-like doman-containing protein [Xenococcaceae cyanobacterium MO_167.B27]
MKKSNFEEKQSRTINRTICIGLGGTGRDILMRIRRLIVDRYGNFKQLPVISFVHIDTDKATSRVTDLRTGNSYHGVDLRFTDAERVSAVMSRSEVNNMVQELGRRSSNYEGSPGVYKNIEQWFPPQLLKNLKAIDEGAQAIRPVGRLAFFHNYRQIKNALISAEQRTRRHDAFLLKKGLRVANKLNIFVVGSLCGGTGSGIFLDIAYTLRKMYGVSGAQIVGYLVISPELYGNAPDKSANTYAALKELNYYATAGTTFKAYYDLQNMDYVEESRPPFEYVYLVSNRTARDYCILEKSKLCNIIAHKITLDFAGELAPIITAQRDNFLQHLIQTDEHPRPNVQRYLTFGFAEIYFPRDIAVAISLNRIKMKLVRFWLQGEGQSADPRILLERFLESWYDKGESSKGFITKLKQATTDGSKTFSNALSSWRNRLETDISETQTRDERQDIILQLGREIRNEFRKVQPGETSSSRGLWLTNAQQTSRQITEQFSQDIDRYLTDLLNPNSINFSINNARAWLEALTTELNQAYRELETRLSSLGQFNTLEAVEKKWKDTEQIINDIENKKGIAFFNKQKNGQVQEEAKTAVAQVSKQIEHNYQLSLVKEAIEIVKHLQDKVAKLITQSSAFANLLNNIKVAYSKEELDLQQRDVDEMSGEAIFTEGDRDDCYDNLLPDHDRTAQLALVSSKITEKIGNGESLVTCLERNAIDEQQLQSEISLTVDSLFSSRSLSTVQSAVKRFLESYSLGDRGIRLEQILREAEPLLPLNISDPYFYNDPGKSLNIIGFKDTDKGEVSQFKNILFQDLGIPDTHLKPIQTEDEIVLVTEYAAFPLRIIDGLQQMREHYQRQKTHGRGFLHNDYRTQFIDIIPPDARKMSELQDIFYSSLAFELLPYDSNTNTYHLEYYDSLRQTKETITLSSVWDEALEKLASIQDMVNALDEKLNEAIADITRNPSKWEKYYLPKLRNFVVTVDKLPEEDPNYLYKDIVVGTRIGIDNSRQQDGIVNRFWRRMEEIVRKEFEKQQQTKKLTGNNTSDRILIESNSTENNPEINIPVIRESPDNYAANNLDIIEAEYSYNSPNSQENKMAQLRELIEMKEKGYLSEAEFSAAKKKILGI